MKKISEQELNQAYKIWQNTYDKKESEKILSPFLDGKICGFKVGQSGWLKRARKGLFMSTESVAKKLEVSKAAYSKYEECEEKGSITLATLAKAAEAMDCELVYAIRPKSKKYFSQIIFERLLPKSLQHPWLTKCDQKRRYAGLAYVLKKNMVDPKFRKDQGWSQRLN